MPPTAAASTSSPASAAAPSRFAETAPGVVAYFGDEGRREVAVSTSRARFRDQRFRRRDPAADQERQRHVRHRRGLPANTGTGVISPGSVVDSTALTNHDYYGQRSPSVGDVTTYDVDRQHDARPRSRATRHTWRKARSPIAGMQFAVEGAPAHGDSFTMQPSSSVSVFSTLAALRTALSNGRGKATWPTPSLTNALNTANSNLTNALDRVLSP
jgi:flagellar hook-associated protein 3 FlgL